MKILGTTSDGYIVDMNDHELMDIFNAWYDTPIPGLMPSKTVRQLKVGDEISASLIHNFNSEIKRSCDDMVKATKSFKDAQDALFGFAQLVVADIDKKV